MWKSCALRLRTGVCLGLTLLLTSVGATEVTHNCFPNNGFHEVKTIIFDPQPVISSELGQAIREHLVEIYSHELGLRGSALKIFETENMQFAAYAARGFSGEYNVEIYKGVRYHHLMTPDAYALIACHEIGHHLGGFPQKRGSYWAAVEGQADYYANLKCLRRYLKDGPPKSSAPPAYAMELVDQCHRSYKEGKEVTVCLRALQAARELGAVLGDLDGGSSPPDLASEDRSQAVETMDSYPSPQCRVDTLRAGALCPASQAEPLSSTDPRPGACTREYFPEWSRPNCWYFPGAFSLALVGE